MSLATTELISSQPRSERRLSQAIVSITAILAIAVLAVADDTVNPPAVDPAAWGDDHVGQPLPAYVTGDECLFCHRETGATWGENRHQRSMRPLHPHEPAAAKLRELGEVAADARFLLGSRRLVRFLRRSKEYGKLEVLSASFAPETNEVRDRDSPAWDTKIFADRCAGCHATAVDPQTRAFSAVSLDCFVCHGEVDLAHTKDKGLVLLSGENNDSRKVDSFNGKPKATASRTPRTLTPSACR